MDNTKWMKLYQQITAILIYHKKKKEKSSFGINFLIIITFNLWELSKYWNEWELWGEEDDDGDKQKEVIGNTNEWFVLYDVINHN